MPILAGLAAMSLPADAAEHAYVALENAARVAVIDLSTGGIVQQIQVGPLPRFVTASADGSVVVVINEGDQTLSVISTADNAVVETLRLADILPSPSPDDIANAGAGELLFEGMPHLDGVTLSDEEIAGLAEVAGLGGRSGTGLMTNAEIAISNDGSEIYLPDQLYGLSAHDRETGETRTFGSQPGNSLTTSNYLGVIRFDERANRLLIPSHNSVTLFDTETLVPGSIVETRGFLSRPAFEITHDGQRVITPPSFNIGSADVAVEMEITDLQTFDYRRVEVTGSAPMRQRPSGHPAIPEYRGIWETADTELSPDDTVFYAVRSYSALGGTPRLGGGGLGEIGAFDIGSGETIAIVDLETEVFGLQTFNDGRYLALVHPPQNRIDVRDAGSLELIRSINVGPTPRGGQNFIVNVTATHESDAVVSSEPATIVPAGSGNNSSSGIEF
jgi:hypothetical protein